VNAAAPAVVNRSKLDGYLRYQLWGLEQNRDRRKVDYFVQGSDLDGWLRSGNFAPRAGQWQKFDLEQKKLVGEVLRIEPKNFGCTFKRVEKYVVLRVDSSGAITCVGDGAGQLLAESCAASLGIVPARILRA
jgi:hypothetical protein